MIAPIDDEVDTHLPSTLARAIRVSRPYTKATFHPPTTHSAPWSQDVRLNAHPAIHSEFDGSTGLFVTRDTTSHNVVTVMVDSVGRTRWVKMSGFSLITLGYDEHGKVIHVQQGSGRAWRYAYNGSGRLITIIDTLGHATALEYDDAGRVTKETTPNGNALRFGYNHNGQLTSLMQPDSSVHTFSYTAAGNTDTYTPPSVSGVATPATSYLYNYDGQLRHVNRPDGAAVLLHYDNAGRVDNLSSLRGVTRVTYSGMSGLIASMLSPDTVTVNYTHDGSLLKKIEWSGAIPGASASSVEMDYDADFRVSAQRINTTQQAAYTYDDQGLVTAAGDLTIQRADSTGLVTGTTVSNVSSAVAYSGRGEVSDLTYTLSGSHIFEQHIARDSTGRIARLVEYRFGIQDTVGFVYDVEGRLAARLAGNGDTTTWYDYDANGNRLRARGTASSDTVSATYDHQDRLLRYGATRFAYSAAGELTARYAGSDTTLYSYDAIGSLMRVKFQNGDTLTYAMDGDGRRVGRRLDGRWTGGWLYQSSLSVTAELDSGGAVKNRYVYGTRGNVPDYVVQGGTTYRLVTDYLGSVRAVVNASTGAVAQQIDYDPWGVPIAMFGATFQGLGYAGGLTDGATTLVRFGARDYLPGVGRWTAKDPMGYVAGTNYYSYVEADPVSRSDPLGLFDFDSALQGAGNFSAGFGDNVTFGLTSVVREAIGANEAVDRCSDAYSAGNWAGVAWGVAFAAEGALAGNLRPEWGNWKQDGRYVVENGEKLFHWHWGEGPGLIFKHLPWEAENWLNNFGSLVSRGRAGQDLRNIGKVVFGLGITAHGTVGGCGCDK